MSKDVFVDNHTQPAPNYPSADLIKFRFDNLDSALAKLDGKLEHMTSQAVSVEDMLNAKVAAETVHRGMSSRIKKLEEWNAWAMRVILGALIVAILAAIGIKTL